MAVRIRQLAIATLALSGCIILWRTIAGPFRLFSLPVHSPLNAQGAFGVSTVVLLLLNSWASNDFPSSDTPRELPWLCAILMLTIAVLWTPLQFPLVFDDYTLAQYGERLNGAMTRYYFTQPGGDGFYRPMGYISLGLDGLWADHNPAAWHLLNLILHLANVVFVWWLTRRVFQDAAVALWAGVLFALHGTVLLTATFLAARFDVLAVFFMLAGLILFLRYVDATDYLALTASFVCAFLSFLTKEIGFSFPLLALLLVGRKARSHWHAVGGHWLLASAVFLYRFRLLGGVGGYANSVTGLPDVLNVHPLGYLKGFGLRIWSLFDFPLNWSRSPQPWLVIMLLACIMAMAWISREAHAPRHKLLMALAFTILALLPVAHLTLVDDTLLGAWRFYLASVGFAMFLGTAIRSLPRPGTLLLGAVLATFQISCLWHNISIWGQTAVLAERTCAEAARIAASGSGPAAVSGLPGQIDGVPFLSNGFPACVAFYSPVNQNATSVERELRWDGQKRQIVAR